MAPIESRPSPSDMSVRAVGPAPKLVGTFEWLLFASRWLLAPLFAGLALSLLILLVKFGQELLHLASQALNDTGSQLVPEILGMVDLTLTASLLVIVVFSGYENFVSHIDPARHRDRPTWMGTIDFAGLKLKLMSSIVAISAVQLLRVFMAIETTTDKELWWSAGIHIVFVISTVLLAVSDRVGGGEHGASSGIET